MLKLPCQSKNTKNIQNDFYCDINLLQSGPKLVRHSKILSPIPLVVEKSPCSIRTKAVATLAAAAALRRTAFIFRDSARRGILLETAMK
jgi:hypothetical protein